MKARSIFCSRWRGTRRSIWQKSRSWRLPTSISTFIEQARKLRLELAADYLVMAAWLAYLKSRLLLPEPPTAEGPSAEDMATALANRLRRLEAIRDAAKLLMTRPQLGPRHLCPRPAGSDRRHQASEVDGDALRPSDRLFVAAATPRAGERASGQADRLVARRSARLAGAARRHVRGLDAAWTSTC